MTDGFVLAGNRQIPVFIYEGEKIAIEYPSGKTYEIPKEHIPTVLHRGILPNGENCQVLNLLSPITRLPIVVLED